MAFTSEGCEMTPTVVWLGSYLNACRLKKISIRSQKQVKN
jgi:hypothetical protein